MGIVKQISVTSHQRKESLLNPLYDWQQNKETSLDGESTIYDIVSQDIISRLIILVYFHHNNDSEAGCGRIKLCPGNIHRYCQENNIHSTIGFRYIAKLPC